MTGLELAAGSLATAVVNMVFTMYVCSRLDKLETRVDKLNLQVWKKG